MIAKLLLITAIVVAFALTALLIEINLSIDKSDDHLYTGLLATCRHQNDTYVEINLLIERLRKLVELQAAQSIYSAYAGDYDKLKNDLNNIPIPDCEDLVVKP